jgi:hypothetical protein
MLLIGSRHRRDSCSEAYRFARSGCVPADPKIDLDVSGLLSWGSSIAPPSTRPSLQPHPAWAVAQTSARDCHVPSMCRSCRSSRLQRFLPQRAGPKTHSFDGPRVCCTPQPTMGFAKFRNSLARPRSRAADPKVVDPKVRGSRPLWRRPFEAFPSSAASTMPSPRHVLSDAVAFTGWACPLAVRVALACVSPRRAAPLSTSGLCSTEESVAFVRRCRRTTARCSLGLWIDPFPDAAARRAAQLALDVSPGGPNRFGVPAPERGGRQGVSALSGSMRPMVGSPRREDRVDRGGSGDSRRSNLGRTPPWP